MVPPLPNQYKTAYVDRFIFPTFIIVVMANVDDVSFLSFWI